MTEYITTDMFPRAFELDKMQVKLLHDNAVKISGDYGYCCHSIRENKKGQIEFIFTYDNDGEEFIMFTTPLTVDWIAKVSGKVHEIMFIPYINCNNFNEPGGKIWINYLSRALVMIGVKPHILSAGEIAEKQQVWRNIIFY